MTTTGEEITSQKADESASHKEVAKETEESPISTGEVLQNIKGTSITETISDRETNNKVTDIIKEAGASVAETIIGESTIQDTTIHDVGTTESVIEQTSSEGIGISSEEELLKDINYTTNASGYTITGIKNNMLTDIVIPSVVTDIKELSIFDNVNVKSIVIPESVSSIGNIFIDNCSCLESIIFPDSVRSFGIIYITRCDNFTNI